MPETPANSNRVGTFDGRYQYDHIYPRGRSGETLRAWDPQNGDALVVIKRPAPQDAPPMRAAQQVSIRSERRALERLSGHPVLTELRAVGSFRIGGQSHDYIVMERAAGEIVEEMVRSLAEQGERLPLLEMLVIVDELLDLLVLAHDQQVVYNDVDAKHLFWHRDTYKLKVIDWGNAVLLDESTSNNVTRQTDVLQVGQLLYFLVTGGKRLEAESTPEGDYAVIFGLDAPTAPSMLQNIITQATHPSLRRRYSTIVELRQQLSEVRRPLEDRRDNILNDVQQQLAQRNSPQALEALFERLEEAAALDPGFPRIKTLHAEVNTQLQRLRTQSNIDAARIYLDTANWGRAIETMLDLLNNADEQTAPIIRFIVAAAELLDHYDHDAAPPELSTAIDALQNDNAQQAAEALHASDAVINQLLAERLTMYLPGVTLLRPILSRLRVEAESLPHMNDVLRSLAVIDDWLDTQHDNAITVTTVRNQYQAIETALGDLRAALPNEAAERLSDMLRRAMAATQVIDEQLAELSRIAFSEPQRALQALQRAQQIDPHNVGFAELRGYIEEISLTIDAVAGFKPEVNGGNLSAWFARVLDMLDAYVADVDDQRLQLTHATLQNTADVWRQVCDTLIMGQKQASKALLIRLARQIGELNSRLAKWARDRSEQVRMTDLVEQLSPNTELANKLLECYRLWDTGKYRESAYQMEGAYSLAKTDGELQAVKRLSELSSIPANWLENDGPQDPGLTSRTEKAIVALFLAEERQELDEFTGSTRSESAYVKTMARALLDPLRQHSTAATRILFLHYTLQGMLCVQERDLHGADFWRQVAIQSHEEARTSPVFAAFDHHLTARKLIEKVEAQLVDIHNVAQLAEVRTLLNNPLAAQWLGEIDAGMRQFEDAVKSWEDGEFRTARDTFDAAISAFESGQETAALNLEGLLGWVHQLRDTVAELQNARLKIEEIAHSTRIPAPGETVSVNPVVEETLMNIVIATEENLGEAHAHQVRQWHSTYLAVQYTYTKDLPKLTKLDEFQTHFANLFINRHPTFRLYQVWREATQNMPDTGPASTVHGANPREEQPVATAPARALAPDAPAPPTLSSAQPTHRHDATPAAPLPEGVSDDVPGFVDDEGEHDSQGVDFAEGSDAPSAVPWGIVTTVVVVIVGVVLFALFGGIGDSGDDGNGGPDSANGGGDANAAAVVLPTNTSTPPATVEITATTAATDDVAATATESTVAEVLTATSVPSEAPSATEVPDTATPTTTDTVAPPTATATPLTPTEPPATATATATAVPATATPSPTVNPTATDVLSTAIAADTPLLTGDSLSVDILDALNQPDAGDFSWNSVDSVVWFYPGVNGPWTLGTDEASSQSGPVVVRFSETDLQALSTLDDAAERLQSVEMTMTLAVPSPTDPDSAEAIGSGIYFGLGVENSERERVAAEVRVPRPGSIAFGIRENDNYRERTGYPETNFNVTLRLQRNEDGTVSLFVVEEDGGDATAVNYALGTSEARYRPGTPLLPVIYASRGGVYIVITSIAMNFDPIP